MLDAARPECLDCEGAGHHCCATCGDSAGEECSAAHFGDRHVWCVLCEATGRVESKTGVAALRDSAAALAETVASEPERIAAAVAAEADRIYRAATVGLDDYLAADAKLLDALGRGEVIDEYHPLILARMRRLDYLRDLLAPVTQ